MELSFKKWLRRWRRPARPVIYNIIPQYNGMTLESWRASRPHIEWFRELLATPRFRDVLAVLNNTRPVPEITSTEVAALHGARARGYHEALAVLLELANEPPKDTLFPEPDYRPENSQPLTDE